MRFHEALQIVKEPLDAKRELREVERLIKKYRTTPNSVEYTDESGNYYRDEGSWFGDKIYRLKFDREEAWGLPNLVSFWVRPRPEDPFTVPRGKWKEVDLDYRLAAWEDVKITKWVANPELARNKHIPNYKAEAPKLRMTRRYG